MVDQTFRDADSSKTVEIVEEHGSFLLVRAAVRQLTVADQRGDAEAAAYFRDLFT
jgi:hypothetical protein